MICDKFGECINNQIKKDSKCGSCRNESKSSNITCKENGRRYNLNNDKGLKVVNFLIDGGVYVNESIGKCDRMYFIKDESNPKFIFIELKGKDVKHGLEQLLETAKRHKTIIANNRSFFRLVCSGAPKIANDQKCIDLKREIYRLFKSVPTIKGNEIDEKYSELEKEDS